MGSACSSSGAQIGGTEANFQTPDEIVKKTKQSRILDLSCSAGSEEDPVGNLYRCSLGKLESVPNSVWSCENITSLTLKCNDLQEISPAIGKLVELKSLDVSENSLMALPAEIGALVKLETLDFSENKIKELPGSIGQCTALATLVAFKNILSKLPDEIGTCAALTEVNFYNNKIVKLPKSFSNLENMVDLNVGGNKLKTLPSTDKWKKLTTFRCHQNTLIMLPTFKEMTALEFLKMDMNPVLREMPDFGSEMKSLGHLEANGCDFSELSQLICTMESLHTLNIQSNKIAALCELPPSIVTLNCGSNQLTAIPSLPCSGLKVLFFPCNKIETLDPSLGDFANLERVIAKDNPCLSDDGANVVLDKMEATCTAHGFWLKR